MYLRELVKDINVSIVKAFGGTSPFSNAGQGQSINVEVNKYGQNNQFLGSIYQYITSDGVKHAPKHEKDQDMLEDLKYNAAQIYGKECADFQPAIENVDYQSVHVFK